MNFKNLLSIIAFNSKFSSLMLILLLKLLLILQAKRFSNWFKCAILFDSTLMKSVKFA